MMYFGRDESGCYVQQEGTSEVMYVTEDEWRWWIDQTRYRPPAAGAEPVRLAITMAGRVDKYEGDRLVETIELDSETSIL